MTIQVTGSYEFTSHPTEDPQQELIETPPKETLKHRIAKYCSLRGVIISVIVFLVITCCVLVWLASYIGSYNAIVSLTDDLKIGMCCVLDCIYNEKMPYRRLNHLLTLSWILTERLEDLWGKITTMELFQSII